MGVGEASKGKPQKSYLFSGPTTKSPRASWSHFYSEVSYLGLHKKSFFLVVRPLHPPPSGTTTKKITFFAASLGKLGSLLCSLPTMIKPGASNIIIIRPRGVHWIS